MVKVLEQQQGYEATMLAELIIGFVELPPPRVTLFLLLPTVKSALFHTVAVFLESTFCGCKLRLCEVSGCDYLSVVSP